MMNSDVEFSSSSKNADLTAAACTLSRLVKLTHLLLHGVGSRHHSWVTELSEALRVAVTTPINLTFSYTQGGRGCHSVQSNSLYQLLTLLRDALLHMR